MRFFFWVMGVVALFFAMPQAQAKNVRICYDDWRPYAFEEDGVAHGLAVDMARKFLRLSGHDVTFIAMPQARCQFSVRYGAADGILLEDRDAATQAGLKTSAVSLVSQVTVAVVRASFLKTGYAGPETFDGANWLQVIGESYPDHIVENASMHAVEVGESARGFDMLKFYHVDVVFTDQASMRYHIGQRPDAMEYKVLRPAVDISERYLSLRSDLAGVLDDFDHAMSLAAFNGELDDLYHDYLGFSRKGFERYILTSNATASRATKTLEQ